MFHNAPLACYNEEKYCLERLSVLALNWLIIVVLVKQIEPL